VRCPTSRAQPTDSAPPVEPRDRADSLRARFAVTALLLIVGVGLIALAALDVLITTVSLGSGAGPVTRAVSRGSWGPPGG
jgi:hypothetical protein